jgi:DNA polymerase-3 subunit delta'
MLIGHKKIWNQLGVSYKIDRLAHGYLFFGEDSLGKKKLAKEFIKLLNCESPEDGLPCQNCRPCQLIEKESHPDFLLIEPLKREIQIDQIRELKHTLTLKPYEGKYKSVIINEAHALNQEAYSCLLKTLEEPLGKAILILISRAKESLPKTILSRVEQIKFHKIDSLDIEKSLRSRGAKEATAQEISLISEGRPGIGLNYLNAPEYIEKEKEFVRDFIKIKKSSLAGRFQYIKDLTDGENAIEVLRVWLKFLRGALLSKVGVQNKNQIYKDFYKDVDDLNLTKIKKLLTICEELNILLTTTNVNQKLALETLMIEL